jgi:hypothetical protein
MKGHPAMLLAADALTVWAWTSLVRSRQPMFRRPTARTIFSFIGLLLGSLSALWLSLAVLANWWSGNAGTITESFNLAATIAFCVAVLGCGLSIIGVGWARLFAVLVSLVTAAAWFSYVLTLRSGL